MGGIGRNDMDKIGRNDMSERVSWFMRRRGFFPPLSCRLAIVMSSYNVISSKARNPVPQGSPERFLPDGRNDMGGIGRNDMSERVSWFMRRRGFFPRCHVDLPLSCRVTMSFRARREILYHWGSLERFLLTGRNVFVLISGYLPEFFQAFIVFWADALVSLILFHEKNNDKMS
jgi:hypothetical protein